MKSRWSKLTVSSGVGQNTTSTQLTVRLKINGEAVLGHVPDDRSLVEEWVVQTDRERRAVEQLFSIELPRGYGSTLSFSNVPVDALEGGICHQMIVQRSGTEGEELQRGVGLFVNGKGRVYLKRIDQTGKGVCSIFDIDSNHLLNITFAGPRQSDLAARSVEG